MPANPTFSDYLPTCSAGACPKWRGGLCEAWRDKTNQPKIAFGEPCVPVLQRNTLVLLMDNAAFDAVKAAQPQDFQAAVEMVERYRAVYDSFEELLS